MPVALKVGTARKVGPRTVSEPVVLDVLVERVGGGDSDSLVLEWHRVLPSQNGLRAIAKADVVLHG